MSQTLTLQEHLDNWGLEDDTSMILIECPRNLAIE